MPKRRANGEGNIRKRKDGRWEGRYTAGRDPETGKAIIKNVLGKTQTEVKEKLKKAIEENVGIDYGQAKAYTVGSWLEVWMENYAKVKLRPSTFKTSQGFLQNHIKPQIGNIPLAELSSLDLQKFYKHLLEGGRVDRIEAKKKPKGLAPKTVRNIHQMICSAYNLAMEQKLVNKSPTQGCALPKVEHKEMKTLTADQLSAFFREAKESGVYELYYLDLATGLRRGELLGLKWADVDFDRGALKIQRAISRQNGKVVEAPLKTKNAYRTLPLSAEEQPAVPTADEQAAALINAQEWFRLEACYPEIRDELSPFVRLLCEASLGSHFNRLPESCNAIGTLLNDYQQELFADPEGSMLGWLLSMLIGNLQELGAYEQAADLLTQFAAGQSEEERASTLATQRWFQTMARHPRTSLTKPDGEIRLPLTVGSETVKSPLDGTDKKVHNFYTDITIGGRTERFIFDTGCSGASFVSAEFAKRHDLEIICDSISVSGIGGNGFVKFATTDSMQIGPVTIRHPYFMVFDNDEASDQIGHIEAVLGTDFMRLAGQIELRPKEGFFLLPATPEPTPASGRNLMHDTSSGQYILNTLVAGKDTVPMVFDTGNSRTGLSPNYYTLHREEIDRSGKKRETAAGGFGGILRGTGYDLKNITFTIGNGSRTLKKVTVTADFGPASEQPYFGSLGMDLFEKFDRIVFDFGRMFVTAE